MAETSKAQSSNISLQGNDSSGVPLTSRVGGSRWKVVAVAVVAMLTLIYGRTALAPPPWSGNHDLEAKVAALQARVSRLEHMLQNLRLNQEGDLVLSNANLYIQSGEGATDAPVNGKGNLIIGYDENDGDDDKSGSHNLVIGKFHTYSSFSGSVGGSDNAILAAGCVVGGAGNTASGDFASVSGGSGNTASGDFASVSGGAGNTASGLAASVSGGAGNTASGNQSASVSGGFVNIASGDFASVSGGSGNTASGNQASISGGSDNVASASGTSISGGLSNSASAFRASVSGGWNNDASADFACVSGGCSRSADQDCEHVP